MSVQLKLLECGVIILYGLLTGIGWHWMIARGQTRGTTFFGAHTEPGFRDSDKGRAILKQFRSWLWMWTMAPVAVRVLVLACVRDHMMDEVFFAATILLCTLAGPIAFAMAHGRTRRETIAPSEITVRMASLVSDGGSQNLWLDILDWLAMLVPPVVPAATLVYLAFHWHQLHIGDRSAIDFFMVCFSLVAGLAGGTNQWALRYRSRSSDWAPTPGASHKYRTYLGAMMASIITCIGWQACSDIMMRFGGRFAGLRLLAHFLLWVSFLFLLSLCAMIFWFKKHLATESGDPMSDRYWKWGYFYFNHDDSALVVPARAGFGFSHNFARPWVWWVGGAVTAMAIATFVMLSRS